MRTLALGIALALFAAGTALAAEPDWSADTIELVTRDEDGDVRETTIWVGVVDGVPYVRTTESRWLANLGRDPNLLVRAGDAELPMRAEPISDAALRARVNEAFRAKYGFSDRVVGWFGNAGGKTCLALLPR